MKQINRRSVSMFCVVFFCLAILTGVIVSTAYVRSSEKETMDYVAILNNETDEVFSHMVQPLSSSIDSGNSIFNSTWYKHYQNIADIYADEFTALKRNDIYLELQRLAAGQQLVEDFLVVMPERGYIVGSNGWYTMRMYEQVYDAISIDSSAGYTEAPVIAVNDPDYCVIVIPDPTVRKYKNVIVAMVPKETFRKELAKYLDDRAVWVRAELNDQLLVDTGEGAPEDCIVMSRSDSGAKLKVTIGYKSYEDAVGRDSRTLYLVMMGAALAVSAFVSLFITVLFIRPINQMILHFGGEHRDLEDPYRFIYEYVDTFSKNGELLSKENSMLLESRNRLLSMLRNEIVSNVLTSENCNFQEDYIQSSFPWLAQSGYFVIAACQNGYLGASAAQMTAADFCEECENSCFATIGQESWFVYCFANEEQQEKGREQLNERMKKLPHVISETFHTPAELHSVYLKMRGALKEQMEQWMHLPILTQSKLVALARTNKREELCQTIAEISENHSLDSVFWLLSRLAWEYDLEQAPSMERYHIAQESGGHEEVLALLQEYAVALCTYTANRRAVNTDNSPEVIRYIDENFKDPNLSVNLLADEFGIHRTLISKMVKASTGETFSDYVTNLRMEEAKKLLLSGVRPVAAVGEKVGIPNYSTFKRTFMKSFGESPKEWSDNHM